MRIGGLATVLLALLLAGCASSAPASDNAQAGVRVQGSVLLTGGDGNCWVVKYEENGSEVQAPLAVPPGYTSRTIAMADPSNPGQDIPGPALMDESETPVGWANGTVVFAGNYGSLDDPALAEQRDACNWVTAPLVPDQSGGLSIDPDGLEYAVYTCREGSGDAIPDAGEVAQLLEECDKLTVSPEPNASS